MLSADEIVILQDQQTHAWHHPSADFATVEPVADSDPDTAPNPDPESDWLNAVARQHSANFDLWHIEDEARAPGASDAELASVKRRIDQTNQRRNDLAEQLDRALIGWLEAQSLPNPEAPLHSESPGLIVDRLSILALKIYHTREEAEREDAPPAIPSETGSGSPFLKSSAPTWPAAWMHCGGRPWPVRGDSSSTAS